MYELIASGEIPSVLVGGTLRVPVDGLRQWVAQQVAERRRNIGDPTQRGQGRL